MVAIGSACVPLLTKTLRRRGVIAKSLCGKSADRPCTKGRDALKQMIAGTGRAGGAQPAAPRPQLYHTTANHQIVFTSKDSARIDAYHITVAAGSGRETPPRVAGVGRSIDELVRVNGQWLIKSRNVAPMD